MPLFGSHLSIAGGYHKAVRAAAELGFDCVQIFTKNNNQWAAKPLSDSDVEMFAAAMKETGFAPPISHNSYLINLATGDEVLRKKSEDAMVVELERAHALGVPHVVAHPGAHVGDGEEIGVARVAESLDRIFERTSSLPTTVALESTAGQGTCLGARFEHLAGIIERCRFPNRLTVCLDSCHLFAAGYPLGSKSEFEATIAEFDRLVGLHRLVAWHLNDSKKDLGSRVDRHEHIGLGKMGIEPFRNIVSDPRFDRLPMILETAKEDEPASGRPWDSINLEKLKELASIPVKKTRAKPADGARKKKSS